MNRRCVYTVFLLAGTFLAAPLRGADRVQTADLLVYGGTASGVMTAYSAAQEGLQVVLLEPGAHLGGMVTGGLSATDTGRFTVIGGYARDFYRKAAAHYRVHGLDRREDWFSEPHVGEAIFREMLRASGVRVYYHTRLRSRAASHWRIARLLRSRHLMASNGEQRFTPTAHMKAI